MKTRAILAGVLIAMAAAGCQAAARPPAMAPPREGAVPLAPIVDPVARPELVRQPYSPADVKFMSGMIPHHAQAVIMAGWAQTHGARPALQLMCERILVSQRERNRHDANVAARSRSPRARGRCQARDDGPRRNEDGHAHARDVERG